MSSGCGRSRRVLSDVGGPQPLTPDRISAKAHVDTCDRCHAFFEENEQLAALTRQSVLVTAPADVRERVFERVAAQRARQRSRPVILAATVASAVLLTVIAVWQLTGRNPADAQLAMLAAEHARAATDERLASGDAREVEKWLTSRVGYGVFVPTLSNARVVGARIAETDVGRSAVVEYEASGRRVSYFIVETPPSTGTTADGIVHHAAVKGYSIAQWRDRGLLHAFVGNVSAAELRKMARECFEQARAPVRANGLTDRRTINHT